MCKYNEWNRFASEPPKEMRVSDWEQAKVYSVSVHDEQVDKLKAQAQRRMRRWPFCPDGGDVFLVPQYDGDRVCIALWCDC